MATNDISARFVIPPSALPSTTLGLARAGDQDEPRAGKISAPKVGR